MSLSLFGVAGSELGTRMLQMKIGSLRSWLPMRKKGGELLPGGSLQPIYKKWVRTSYYITVSDGTRLATDIFFPTEKEKPIVTPLPVIWTHHRYHRSSIYKPPEQINVFKQLVTFAKLLLKRNTLQTQMNITPWLKTLIKCGYVIAVVDVRGGGASYGTYSIPFSQEEANDAYDITEWLAAQSWCNRSVGMFGDSYMGVAQYMAASSMPPHLKAIFPEMAMFDLYDFTYPGGVFRYDFVSQWSRKVKELDSNSNVCAAPVDQDGNGYMLAEAIQHHQANRDILATFASLPYRNSQDKISDGIPYISNNPSSYLEEVKKSGVAIYHLAGWYDMWCRDALLWFKNLDNPQIIVIGPWSHSQRFDFDLAAEHLRWYDYWLKNIDNGIMKSAPIRYYTMNSPKGKEWSSTWQWPLLNQQLTNYYFCQSDLESTNHINSSLLTTQPPQNLNEYDDYTVDYTTTSGKATRWTNGYGGSFGYVNMIANDEKGLTYTTVPLTNNLRITGHPVIHLWITSTVKDGDFFAYLEEVDHKGFSHYITEGVLRASNRAISKPPYDDYIGLPYHSGVAEEAVELPDQPVELVFELYPTSYIFRAGNHLRVAICCADKDNALTIELMPPPSIKLHRNANHASYITLPIINDRS
jgi:uncharacterized protein